MFLCLQPVSLLGQSAFPDVKLRTHKSDREPKLVDKVGVLALETGKIRFTSKEASFELADGEITAIEFDESTHRRGGALSEALASPLSFAGTAASVVAGQVTVTDYWMHISAVDEVTQMLEIPKESAAAVRDIVAQRFRGKVTTAVTRKGEPILSRFLKDSKSKHRLKLDWRWRLDPELEPGKALIVVVCPPPAARHSGQGQQIKIHVDDRVVLVNKPGSYGFANIEPGRHQIATQSSRADGMTMEFEAGKTYYFLQDLYASGGAFTKLTQHGAALVLHEMSGAAYARWERKK